MKVLMYETKSTGCGKITGMFESKEFTKVTDYKKLSDYSIELLDKSKKTLTVNGTYYSHLYIGLPCLTEEEYLKYKGDKDVWAWEVESPSKFDKPVELSELYKYGYDHNVIITRAPQSWKYAMYKGELVILLSIHHKYADLIYSGEKTVEVRKSFPRKGNK